MHKMIVTLMSLALFFLLHCGKEEPSTPSSETGLSGHWSESYTWNGSLIRLQPPDSLLDIQMTRTTTLRFAGDQITITILPPYRILSYSQGSSYIRMSDDTLYSGTFSANDSILYLDLWDDLISPAPYYYELFSDSLCVSTFPPNLPINGTLLWGSSLDKISGVFKRK